MLELGRHPCRRGSWRHDLRLILFGGEEEGLFGSKQYVAALPPAERSRIRAVLNMDMIATRNTACRGLARGRDRVVEPDRRPGDGGRDLHRPEGGDVAEPFASDHVPFINAGIPAVLTIEGADSANGHIHSDQDAMAHIDRPLMQAILRMNLAALAGWLEQDLSVPRPSGPVVASAPGRLDVFAVGMDSAVYHKAWDGNAWQPSVTDYEPLGGTVVDP